MNWIETEIFTTTNGVDVLCTYLLDIGIKGFVIKDSNDFKEFLDNKVGNWDYIDDNLMNLSNCETSVTVYIPNDQQGADMVISLKSLLKFLKSNDKENIFGSLNLRFFNVNEQDWANNWKQYFKPICIGNRLVVKPSWEKYENIDNRIILEIDPASSFGTGQHHTTRLCLQFLEECINKGDRILDLGCGSGILSIGAILLGADSATAIDIEDHCVKTAIENAKKNSIPDSRYTAYCGNIVDNQELSDRLGTGYDIITANIVADVLIAMRYRFKQYLKENGILIISGIIDTRKNEVIEKVSEVGFRVEDIKELDGWVSIKLINQ